MKNSLEYQYHQGVFKISKPSSTYKYIKQQLKNYKKLISKKVFIPKSTHIPQYLIYGTDEYISKVNSLGRPSYSINANGKGHNKQLALISGLMELIERYSCNYYIQNKQNQLTTSFNKLKNNLFTYNDFIINPFFKKKLTPLPESLVQKHQLIWYKAKTLDNQSAYIPYSIIAYMQEITNGMAAGNTIEEALLHGICEIIERHYKSIVRLNKYSFPTINQHTITSKIAKKLIYQLKATGHRIILKDFSHDLKIPIIGTLRIINNSQCYFTIGVAPQKEEAMIRSLTENSQIDSSSPKNIKTESSLKKLIKTTNKSNYHDIVDYKSNNIKLIINQINQILKDKNMTVWYINTTHPVIRIPTIIVFITNTLRNNLDLAHRNIIIGFIEEALKIPNYHQASFFINYGLKNDSINKDFYNYYQGVVWGFKKKYIRAINSFIKVINQINRLNNEIQKIVFFQIGVCFFLLGKQAEFQYYFINNYHINPLIKPLYYNRYHLFVNKSEFNTINTIYINLISKLKNPQKNTI